MCESKKTSDFCELLCVVVIGVERERDGLACSQIENTVVISDYQQMDRILKEERNYIADLCKTRCAM